MEEFNYEKLDIYRCSMEFLAIAYALIEKLPRGYATLSDQLRRSSLSVPLNIAEGSAKSTSPERMRYFEIARASALECSAVLNCCSTLKLAKTETILAGRTLLIRIVQMLSKLGPRVR